MSHSLRLDHVRIMLHGRLLLEIDAEIGAGEVLTVMGRSGMGKSTLLNAVAGFLEKPFSLDGRILVDGEDVVSVAPEQRHAGLMFQDSMLFPHMSVAGNIGFALPSHHKDRNSRIEQALLDVGLEGFGPRDPATLSGGQQSRVALMRTLLAEPNVVLMDEPFSKLDTGLRREIREMTFSMITKSGLPALLVTHDIEDAKAAGGTIVNLDEQGG